MGLINEKQYIMKKLLFFILAALLLAPVIQAQTITAKDSAILNRIHTANQQYRTLQNNFRHDLIKKGTTYHRYGTLYVTKVKPAKKGDIEANISMLYSDPKGEYYIINTTHLYNGIDGHKLKFNYKFVPLMKLLGNAMSWSMNGDIYSIYNNLNTDFQMATDAKHYIITLTVKKGYNRGISKMLLKYDKTTGLIDYMEMEEKLGLIHKYYMGLDTNGKTHKPLLNTPIDTKVYTLD